MVMVFPATFELSMCSRNILQGSSSSLQHAAFLNRSSSDVSSSITVIFDISARVSVRKPWAFAKKSDSAEQSSCRFRCRKEAQVAWETWKVVDWPGDLCSFLTLSKSRSKTCSLLVAQDLFTIPSPASIVAPEATILFLFGLNS